MYSVCTRLTQLHLLVEYKVFFIRYNYIFWRLIMAIFKLYMKYLLSSFTKHSWALYRGKGGGKVGTTSRICQKFWAAWFTWGGGPCCY